jgi:hypothetical protein
MNSSGSQRCASLPASVSLPAPKKGVPLALVSRLRSRLPTSGFSRLVVVVGVVGCWQLLALAFGMIQWIIGIASCL